MPKLTFTPGRSAFIILAIMLLATALPFLNAQNREGKAEERRRAQQERLEELEREREREVAEEEFGLEREFRHVLTSQNRKILEKDLPGFLKLMDALKKSQDADAGEELEEIMEHTLELLEMREEEPGEYRNELKNIQRELELRSIQFHTEQLGQVIQKKTFGQNNGGPSRDELVKELKKSLIKEFDLRLASRQREIEQVERELKQLKSRVERREKKRDLIIQRRMQELMGEEDDLDWWW